MVVDSPPGMISPSNPAVGGQAHFGGLNAQAFKHGDVFGKIALDGKDTNFINKLQNKVIRYKVIRE